MKFQKILASSFILLIFLQFLFLSQSTEACGSSKKRWERRRCCPPEKPPLDPEIKEIIDDIKLLTKKIIRSEKDLWKRPSNLRKMVIISKLYCVKKLLVKENLEGAYNKMLKDIKPKLTEKWVADPELQEIFRIECDKILLKINSLINPPYEDEDTEAPKIILTPNMTIADGNALEGILVEWQITDFSGLAEALVLLNGNPIASYAVCNNISDSILLPNIPGKYNITVYARDNDNDPDHPEGDDWLESWAQTTISVYDDETTPPNIYINYSGRGVDFDPGKWTVDIWDNETGIAEIQILVDGEEIINDDINGQRNIVYEIPLPGVQGLHLIEVYAANNDIDWMGDQELSYEESEKKIVAWT